MLDTKSSLSSRSRISLPALGFGLSAAALTLALVIYSGLAGNKNDEIERRLAELGATIQSLEATQVRSEAAQDAGVPPSEPVAFLSPPFWGSDLEAVLPACLGGDGVDARERDGCRMYFFGVLAGTNATLSLLEAPPRFCFTPTTSDRTLIEGVLAAVANNSDLDQVSAPGAIILALEETLPCPRPDAALSSGQVQNTRLDADAEMERNDDSPAEISD